MLQPAYMAPWFVANQTVTFIDTRNYTIADEGASKIKCPLCKVYSSPRGLTSTRYASVAGEGKDKTCPNCGYNLYRTWLPID